MPEQEPVKRQPEPAKKLDRKESPKEPEQRNDEDTGPPVGEQEDVNEREADGN